MIGALAFRLWRLDLPRSMIFDEVYHARSATEWLADWEHGWTRDTYEWTHPMLAKYLIAAGIVVADPNQVVTRRPLDSVPVAVAVAPQRTASDRPESVVFTADGSRQIIASDALSGQQLAAWDAAGPVDALAYDEDAGRLLVGRTDTGQINVFDVSTFLTAHGTRAPPVGAAPIDTGLAAVSEIEIPADQAVILARGPDGIAELERTTGASLAATDLVVASVAYVPSPSQGSGGPWVVAVSADRTQLLLLDAATLAPSMVGDIADTRDLPATAAGPIQVRGSGTDLQVWVPVGALPADNEHPAVDGGITVFNDSVSLIDTAPLPGRPEIIGWQSVANIIYIAGQAPDGAYQLWTVQPLGNGGTQSVGFAAYDTTPLAGDPQAMAFDMSDHDQGDDHERLLVSVATGTGGELTGVDVGSNAFAWRLAGVLFGSVLVGLVYLLAATMFRRRRIAVLAAIFVAVDGMSYVMSRIAMNDIFVATFIVGGYLVFWQIWSGRWARSAWWALPLVGVLIGLAAASKWVGIYALMGLWILVLARSHLGRFLLVAGAAVTTAVLGAGAPWPFLAFSVLALALALVVTWIRPVRLTSNDLLGLAPTMAIFSGVALAFTIGYSQVPDVRKATSAVELIFGVLAGGAQAAWPAWIMLGIGALLLVMRAVASLRKPESDRRWMQPGGLGGFNWPWIGACLIVIPLVVYFLAYIPYLELGHNIAGASAGPGYGWSLDELQAQMFGYHFGLQAGHPAASPWWSWPLDLKPVWFYGHDFDSLQLGPILIDRRIAVVYNGGNPILFWAGVPAILWCSLQAWRRRSPALVLVVAAFALQFLPWTRIERATFQYHYLTAVLFAMIAVAYVLDEALRSWSWRPFGIAFIVLAAVAGVLVFPMGSALAMPDWYINAARTLLPWNYAFQFPNPPQGVRPALISTSIVTLAVGTVLALGSATWALWGREVLRGSPQRDEQEEDADRDEPNRPEPVDVDVERLTHEEPAADAHEDQTEDHGPVP